MEKAFGNLKSIADSENANFNIALLCREAYLSAFQGKSSMAIELRLKSNGYLTESAFENVMKHVDDILKKNAK